MSDFLPVFRTGLLKPIHIVRHLMSIGWRQVCQRTWEIRELAALDMYGLDSDPDSDICQHTQIGQLFPELEGAVLPVRVTGERLVERLAFINEVEYLVLVRINTSEPDGIDIDLTYDTGAPAFMQVKDVTLHKGLLEWVTGVHTGGHPC